MFGTDKDESKPLWIELKISRGQNFAASATSIPESALKLTPEDFVQEHVMKLVEHWRAQAERSGFNPAKPNRE